MIGYIQCYILMIVIYFMTTEKIWIFGINACFYTLLSMLITLLLKRVIRII